MKVSRGIPSLDGLRAVSIILVVVSHISTNLFAYHKDFFESNKMLLFIQTCLTFYGRLGVVVFFVISGFLITTLLLKDQELDLKKFYFRRTLRIFPPYYFYLIVIFLAGPASGFLAAITYTSNYFSLSWNLAHTWSLAVEEQFYLILPFAMLVLGRKKGYLLPLAAIVVCPLIRLVYLWNNPGHYVEFSEFEAIADSLAIGCLLAHFRRGLHENKIYLRLLNSPLIAILPFLIFLISSLPAVPKYNNKMIFVALLAPFQNLCITLIIDYCVTNSESLVGKILNIQPLAFIGIISYSIYLWQQPLLNPALNAPLILKIMMIPIFALCSYYFVEKPFLELRHGLPHWQLKPVA
jgi:peptidoglycan/LPS O-acetylase OafA/YrhL